MTWSWWPENSAGIEHEAWIQPIFEDGEEGTGTTNNEGVIFDHYQPSERTRPFSEIAQLRIVCSCGWTGPTWALGDLPQWAVSPWSPTEASEAGEDRLFLPDWHTHLAPLKAKDAATCPTCGRA